MIRIAVMMDKKRVIGASNEEENMKRFNLLPKQLPEAMSQLYKSENIAGGESSWNSSTSQATNNRYVITRNDKFNTHGESVDIITDANKLVEKYKDSNEELLIVGGLAMFKFFTPYADVFDIAESDNLIPGDLVYDTWEKQPLQVKSDKAWEGFRVIRYVRNK